MKKILIIAVLTTFAILESALPAWSDNISKVKTQALESARDSFASAVKTGIKMRWVDDLVVNGAPGKYPQKLDLAKNGECGARNLCFTKVIENIDPSLFKNGCWSKVSDLKYMFKCEDVKTIYNYDPKGGEFGVE